MNNLNAYIISASVLLLGCNEASLPTATITFSQAKSPKSDSGSRESESKDVTPTEENKSPEKVTPPNRVTGAQLNCILAPDVASIASDKIIVHCSFMADGSMVDLDEAFASYTWSAAGYSDYSVETLPPSSGAQAAYIFSSLSEGSAEDLLNQVTFVLEAKGKNGEGLRFGKALTRGGPKLAGPESRAPVRVPDPARLTGESPTGGVRNTDGGDADSDGGL